jgi:hypothetical protein
MFFGAQKVGRVDLVSSVVRTKKCTFRAAAPQNASVLSIINQGSCLLIDLHALIKLGHDLMKVIKGEQHGGEG